MPQNQTGKSRNNVKMLNGAFIGAVFLGICVLISGLSIGGGIRKLCKTMEEKSFSSINNINQPESVNYSEKKYLTESEAADYLNLTVKEIETLLTTGEIKEYVKTAEGYSISIEVLDAWFDNEAYQNTLPQTNTDSQ